MDFLGDAASVPATATNHYLEMTKESDQSHADEKSEMVNKNQSSRRYTTAKASLNTF